MQRTLRDNACDQTSGFSWRSFGHAPTDAKRLAGVISLAAVIGGLHPHRLERLVGASDERNSLGRSGSVECTENRVIFIRAKSSPPSARRSFRSGRRFFAGRAP